MQLSMVMLLPNNPTLVHKLTEHVQDFVLHEMKILWGIISQLTLTHYSPSNVKIPAQFSGTVFVLVTLRNILQNSCAKNIKFC